MKTVKTSKVAKCPHCTLEQELFLFNGSFINEQKVIVDPIDGPRYALQHKRIFICEQCAQEAHSGKFVQASEVRAQ